MLEPQSIPLDGASNLLGYPANMESVATCPNCHNPIIDIHNGATYNENTARFIPSSVGEWIDPAVFLMSPFPFLAVTSRLQRTLSSA